MLQTAKEIHVCDISRLQIKFVEHCLDQWNGENFGEFVYMFITKNKVKHWHLNLHEEQNSNKELIKDKNKFIDAVNSNFYTLVDKYRKNTWSWQDFKKKQLYVRTKTF